METNTIVENSRTQMRRGVLEYSILLVLRCSDDYASSIIQKLKDVDIIVVEGTLYPLLIRLKNLGLLTYRWEESPQGPPRKYYALTPEGETYLAEFREAWRATAAGVAAILEGNIGPERRQDDATE